RKPAAQESLGFGSSPAFLASKGQSHRSAPSGFRRPSSCGLSEKPACSPATARRNFLPLAYAPSRPSHENRSPAQHRLLRQFARQRPAAFFQAVAARSENNAA